MTRIHFEAEAPVHVEFIRGQMSGAFFTVTVGSTQLYLSVGQAASLSEQLNKFSAGATTGITSAVSANDTTLAAPAEPNWNRFPILKGEQ